MKKLLLMGLALASLSACSSDTNSEGELKMLADYRASKLASVVPLKMGTMTLMQVISKKETVQLVFIDEAGNNALTRTIIDTSINAYCKDKEVRSVLEQGVKYQYIVRNSRGQIQNDITVDNQTCLDMEPKDDEDQPNDDS